MNLDLDFTEFCFSWSYYQYSSIGSDNGLAQNASFIHRDHCVHFSDISDVVMLEVVISVTAMVTLAKCVIAIAIEFHAGADVSHYQISSWMFLSKEIRTRFKLNLLVFQQSLYFRWQFQWSYMVRFIYKGSAMESDVRRRIEKHRFSYITVTNDWNRMEYTHLFHGHV